MLSYEQTLRLFEKWCKEEQSISTVDKVNENVIRRYIFDLQERGKYTFYSNDKQKAINYPERRRDFRKPVSTITINNYIRNLRVFFNYLERNYIIKKNPMKRVRQLKSNREPKVYLTDDELRKLLSKFDRSYFSEHRDYVMILLMLDSGMRLGECSTLLVSDLELSRKRINLRAEETKGRKERTVFFSPKTEKALRSWLQYKDRYVESDYLFPVKEHGGSIGVGNFEGNFRKYIARAGLNEEYTPHCLRNNFAKRCLMNGMDIYTLSKILGHSSVTVTEQAYLDINEDDMSSTADLTAPDHSGLLSLSVCRSGFCLFLGDEAGGLNAVDQELEFLCVKLPIYNSPSPCPPVILGFIAVFVQKVKIGTDGFLLHGDFVVVVKVFDNFLNLDGMGFVRLFQKIVQKIEQFQPLILRSALSFFTVCHCSPSRIGIFCYCSTSKTKKKGRISPPFYSIGLYH